MRDIANARLNERGKLRREKERFETRVRVRIGDLEIIIDSFMRYEGDSESYFSRDGKKIEMFERADRRLRCCKRDRTSLANR